MLCSYPIAPLQARPDPPLKLVTQKGSQRNPADCSFIEGFHEELELKNSSNETGRTQVSKYTPKRRSSEFREMVGLTTPQKKNGGVFNWAASEDHPDSPKKCILEKLRRTTTRTPQAPTPTSAAASRSLDMRSVNGPPADLTGVMLARCLFEEGGIEPQQLRILQRRCLKLGC